MTEIKYPNNLSDFIEWLGAQISRFIDNDGWCESVYSNAIDDANGFIELFCQEERIDFVPQLHLSTWVVDFDEAHETYRQTTIARLQKLRNAIDPESTEGPVANNKIRIDGEAYSVKGDKPWGVLDFMWHRERAPEDEVIEHVWGHNSDKADIKSAVCRANESLNESKYLKTLHRKSGAIFWK